MSEWDLACTQGHPDLYGSPSACQQLKLGVVHTLPSKQSSELFVRGSERRKIQDFTEVTPCTCCGYPCCIANIVLVYCTRSISCRGQLTI